MKVRRLRYSMFATVLVAAAALAGDPPPPPAMAATGALPDLNADDYFEGQTPGTFGKKIHKILPASKRVAVAGFRVIYVIENTATASVSATYLPGGIETTGAHSKLTVTLQGVDYATMQALTDKAYANFMQQLAVAGREVVPLEQIKPVFAKLELAETSPDKPYEMKGHRGTGLAFSPAGIPLWWVNGDFYGDIKFSQHNMRTIPELSKELNAFVIAPEIVVSFAKMESSGNHSGFVANEAKVGASLAIAVRSLRTQITHATETKFGLLSDGEEGEMHMYKGVVVETPFAEMQETSSKKTRGWAAWATGSAKSHKTESAVTDNDRYAAVAGPVLNQATGVLAKFFQQHAS
jgi:hypothetical protein